MPDQTTTIYGRSTRNPKEPKKVNDSYGHEAGDLALQQVAAVMKSSLREIDLLGRMGGEEFAVLLPDTSLEEAVILAERVRQSIANMSFEIPGQVLSKSITISVGVATLTDEKTGIDDLLRNADAALYRAKHSGRNCVVVDPGNPDVPRPPAGGNRVLWMERKKRRRAAS